MAKVNKATPKPPINPAIARPGRAEARKLGQRTASERRADLVPGVTLNPKGHRGLNGGQMYFIDEEMLENLAKTMASYDEMGTILKVAPNFLHDHYRDVIELGRAKGKKTLRSAQFATAVGGNVVMQIWLGKQYLDQQDTRRVEQSGPDGKPIQSEVTKKVVAYIPDNQRDPVKTPPTA